MKTSLETRQYSSFQTPTSTNRQVVIQKYLSHNNFPVNELINFDDIIKSNLIKREEKKTNFILLFSNFDKM